MLTAEQFSELFPRCADPDGWVEAMNEVFPEYGIDTPQRIAAFIAQCGHESGGWRVFSENLNYSAKALDAVFGKYFVRAVAMQKNTTDNPKKSQTWYMRIAWIMVILILAMVGDLEEEDQFN